MNERFVPGAFWILSFHDGGDMVGFTVFGTFFELFNKVWHTYWYGHIALVSLLNIYFQSVILHYELSSVFLWPLPLSSLLGLSYWLCLFNHLLFLMCQVSCCSEFWSPHMITTNFSEIPVTVSIILRRRSNPWLA